jgi:penicillin-binding protein 1A
MNEVYARRPAPPDWPRPEDIIVRDIDSSDGMLRNPFCPDSLVTTEYFIPGTEPLRECDVHSPFTIGGPADSMRPGGNSFPPAAGPARAIPGGAPVPRPARPRRDTTRRPITDPFHIPPA